ncbi:MAG: beta-ketoacyl synthase N-terminal-like domain-containing protein, partial [Stackebrandtia sp.]
MDRPIHTDRRRVVITGMGAITSIGTGVREFLDALRVGKSGVSPLESFDTDGFAHANGCEVAGFDAEPILRHYRPEQLGRASQFSVAAARQAVADAGMSDDALTGERVLVTIGTTDGESRDLDQLVGTQVVHGPASMDPEIARRVPAGRLPVCIARELGLTDAETVTIPTACAAGNYAIGYAADVVASGEVDIALCGGADAVCRKTFAGFYRLGTIAPQLCQPFDRDRKGILTGEGAGVLMLESLDSALSRN